ncbi:hypothetical protein K2X33_02225 [bacterium]|nr:hypothetical protein [bacterium]
MKSLITAALVFSSTVLYSAPVCMLTLNVGHLAVSDEVLASQMVRTLTCDGKPVTDVKINPTIELALPASRELQTQAALNELTRVATQLESQGFETISCTPPYCFLRRLAN